MWPFKKKFQLLIICRHNITRSAYIAGYLKHYLETYRPDALKRIKIASSGIIAKSGNTANSVVRFIAKQNRFNIDSHRSTKLSAKLVKNSDLILVMSQNQKDFMIKDYPECESRVFLFMEYGIDENEQYISKSGEKDHPLNMPDPTGRNANDFSEFINLANSETDRILHELAHRQII